MTAAEYAASLNAVPLASLADGEVARLVRLDAGTELRARLMAMGLRRGVHVRMVHNRGRGPFVVAVKTMRLVLGRGMVRKILVERFAEAKGGAA